MDLTVIIPTYNERENIPLLIERIFSVLSGNLSFEVLVVDDDSPDGTAAVVRELQENYSNLELIVRKGEKGLTGACIAGFVRSQSRLTAVMDGDLQHRPETLIDLKRALEFENAGLAIASRYCRGGGVEEWSRQRLRISRIGTFMAGYLLGHRVTDPLTGFFMIKTSVLKPLIPQIQGSGFKVLLAILNVMPRSIRVAEVPLVFRPRVHGVSKLSFNVVVDFIFLLVHCYLGGRISVRAIKYLFIGLVGAVVHLSVFLVFSLLAWGGFLTAHLAATGSAMFFNFVMNNRITFSDRKLSGCKFLVGLIRYILACSVGMAINVLVAGSLFDHSGVGWLSSLIGALIGALWNFSLSNLIVWKVSESDD